MDAEEGILSFLDLLDLDEEIIDKRLKSIMLKSNHTNKHLQSVHLLLQYKHLINTKENSDCENDDEYDFTVQLIRNANNENIDYICKIINIVLCLNNDNIINKSEHLMQQILLDTDFLKDSRREDPANRTIDETDLNRVIKLKVCGSILDAIIKTHNKLSLPFLETPIENILDSTDETLKIYFLTDTVPKLFEGIIGYNILDQIWNYIKQLKEDEKEKALQILSCLSDYYLPAPDGKRSVKFESEIVFLYDFWNIILYGIMSNDTAVRKISIYLSKRAIDYVIYISRDICIASETDIVFNWNKNDSKNLKTIWDNFFILIDSLEEKQSNIVLPSLKLFETVDIGECWLNAAYNIGLKHDNAQVRLKCAEYKLKTRIGNETVARVLLEAYNDINIYDNSINCQVLKTGISGIFKDPFSFMAILKAIPTVKWSPVPFYYLSDVLANLMSESSFDISTVIMDILKVPCNSILIRKAVHVNLGKFIKNCQKNLSWRDAAKIISIIQLEPEKYPIVVQPDTFKDVEKICFKSLSESIKNIDLILLYLSNNNKEDMNIFIDVLNEKIVKLTDIINRQYSDKKECMKDAIFLIHMLSKTEDDKNSVKKILYELVVRQNRTIIQYVISLFSSDNFYMGDAGPIFEKDSCIFTDNNMDDILLQLYKICILFLKDGQELHKTVLSLYCIKVLHNNTNLMTKYHHEMLNLKGFLEIILNYQFKDSHNESEGRVKNIFYEKTCQITYQLLEEEKDLHFFMKPLISYIEIVLECGGYGCLKWILKIVNKIVKLLVDGENKFDTVQFVNRVWFEIEELKSNNQYSPCMQELVELLTQDALLSKAMYNNVIISYCKKIIENGSAKTNPLYYLSQRINRRGVQDYGHLIYILCEILLYCPVLRKDERITDNLCLKVLQDEAYGIDKNSIDVHFNFEIQYLSIATLCHINHNETLTVILKFITNKIDETFRNKQRYHGNSQVHKTLISTLQHMLIILLKSPGNMDWLLNWCLDLLVKLPHQPSVRICLEWLVSLCFYIQKISLGENILQVLKLRNVSLTSQFFIMYWLLKHKIINNTYTDVEYNHVLDFLLSHTMGQLFNVRLHAQYLSVILHKMAGKSTKFDYTISVIENTFNDSRTDKNFTKLQIDYFANKFDIIANLNPYFIYYLLPKYCEIDSNESVDIEFVKNQLKDFDGSLVGGDEAFIIEWRSCQRGNEEFLQLAGDESGSKVVQDDELMGTIQKKYVPWKNMSEINSYDFGKKTETKGDLILVASLIDKLPNLGGMARTSEVFGVKTYVVGSLRHLQDKQFQGLSVSAERWVNVEEVRPGRALKEYLMLKKSEGYIVVAAEQTSTSSKLQNFKFPKKTILLLGHEKEGVPCDLLPIMDHCVEIPQQGYVRSLNVHVTAAIFVWEYVRQNVL
ncbi:unnamed protein product [Arctia plantaginis]|uniref:tRNA/rRNA methyltransferase SpoU type domain-containing protein n=1 Tax=Arctia plantaginis TaxID=874455 RepID=A0A8S0ZY83_ARCPL|nr:unnamed protein product [Arctia plantaginis]